MNGIQYNQLDDNTSYENQGQQYTSYSEGPVNSNRTVFTEHQQQLTPTQSIASVPKIVYSTPTTQRLGGIQTTNSFHSISSMDSSAEMAKYFPEASTPISLPLRPQQQVEGQPQSVVTVNTVTSANTTTVDAGSYTPTFVPTAAQVLSQPVGGVPLMAQQQLQQQQQPIRPPGPPQVTPGILSFPSQIEGLSVSQAVVNDVLVDLQTKVINQTLQQYHGETSSDSYLEPLAPIYIRAPQPTIILQSDLHRLRAELGNRVRPPGVYRHPTGAFQQNRYQVPRFPAPPQQHIPPGI
ncbi:unnamed protein product [Rotaria sordida]|uniref:Uncharacterized protein n=1 Tax=Rotaria sordida TaxID=392033 RepID=A0A818SSP8_9BILA|nr:unnamed protein product [Rotaria sordida]